MRIKLTETFFIKQCLHAPFNWDLIKISYGKRKGKKNVRVETAIAYGLSLEHLSKKIADFEIFEKEKDFKTFQEYINQYKEISNEVVNKIINKLKN